MEIFIFNTRAEVDSEEPDQKTKGKKKKSKKGRGHQYHFLHQLAANHIHPIQKKKYGRESDLPKQFKLTSKEVENYLSEEMARYANKLFEEYTPERTLRKIY